MIDGIRGLGVHVTDDGFQSRQVAMDISHEGKPHGLLHGRQGMPADGTPQLIPAAPSL